MKKFLTPFLCIGLLFFSVACQSTKNKEQAPTEPEAPPRFYDYSLRIAPGVSHIPRSTASNLIERAFQRVEREWGEFEHTVSITIVPEIESSYPIAEGYIVKALCYPGYKTSRIEIGQKYFDLATTSHELSHARLNEFPGRALRWWDEGMAEYFESSNGFRPDAAETIFAFSSWDLNKLCTEGVSSGGDLEFVVRAYGWALAYYYRHKDNMTFPEMLSLKQCSHFGNLADVRRFITEEQYRLGAYREDPNAPLKPKAMSFVLYEDDPNLPEGR